MLERVDRVQLVVKDRQAAARSDGLWVHPSALCDLLLGISRTTVGWEWSGQPARVACA
jgi:hypothetical protein